MKKAAEYRARGKEGVLDNGKPTEQAPWALLLRGGVRLGLYGFGDDVGFAVVPGEEGVGFVVVEEAFGVGVHFEEGA